MLVFISYSRKDSQAVNALRRRLRWRGIRTWMDTQDIAGGDWRLEIRKGLRRSNFFVACLSQNTVEAGEVLHFEHESALEIQRERLEGEIYVIPLRLEPCEIPERFRHLQYLDLYSRNGWTGLIRALGSKARTHIPPRYALVLLTIFLASLGAYLWPRSSPLTKLLDARSQGAAALSTDTVELGLTQWKMEPSKASDPPGVREIVHPKSSSGAASHETEWTPVRLPLDVSFRLDDNFEIGIESSRSGYLYVVNRSYYKNASAGPAALIFPTRRIDSGDNRIWPGKMVRLPARTSDPPYWQFQSSRSDYAGELILILLVYHSLDGIAAEADTAPVDDRMVAAWEKEFGGGVSLKSYEAAQRRLTLEEAAARNGEAQLTRAAPPPQFICEAKRASGAGLLCTLKIPVGPKF